MRQQRGVGFSTFAAFLCGVASVSVGSSLAARVHAAGAPHAPFRVVDGAGKAVLAVLESPRALVLYDAAGEEAVSIEALQSGAVLKLSGPSGRAEFSGDALRLLDVGATPGFSFRAQLGRRQGDNYALVFTDPTGTHEVAGIGESTAGAGLAFVGDEAGHELVRLDGVTASPGARILDPKGVTIASISEDKANGGYLVLSDASGEGRVEAGAAETGVGIVRALGPSNKGGAAGFGFPGTYIIGKQ